MRGVGANLAGDGKFDSLGKKNHSPFRIYLIKQSNVTELPHSIVF